MPAQASRERGDLVRRETTSTWILVGLWALAVLGLIASWWITRSQSETARQLASFIDRTEQLVLVDDWAAAASEMEQLQRSWDRVHRVWALHTVHEDLDQIGSALTESAALIAVQDASALAPLRRAKEQIIQLPERDALVLINLF